MLASLAQGATLGFSAAVSPGPFQAYLLAQTMQHGLRRTLLSACAPLLSDAPIIFVVLLVLTQAPSGFLRLLQIAGGIFLVYLAYGAWQTFRTYSVSTAPAPASAGQSLLKATLTNALSPGPWLFWSVLAGPMLVEAWGQQPLAAVGFIVGFYAVMIGSLVVLIGLFATARRAGPRVARTLNGVAAVALLGLGVYQLWAGIRGG